MKLFSLLMLTLRVFTAAATETHYDSGLFHALSVNKSPAHHGEEDAIKAFLQAKFQSLGDEWRWEPVFRLEDRTHIHRRFRLVHQGVPLTDAELKLHYSRQGYIDFATSTLANVPKIRRSQWDWPRAKAGIRSQLPHRRDGYRFQPRPVYWANETGEIRAAFDVSIQAIKPFSPARWIVDGADGRLLEKRKIAREASVSVKVYSKSPFGGAVPVSQNVTTDDSSKLISSEFIVRRDENPVTPTYVDVTPQDFTGTGFTTNPATYDPECEGGANDCPNQGFDAVNVFYHLQNYRSRINDYLSTLGANVDFHFDPLNVVINSLHIDLDGDGDGTDETNNALYLGEPCAGDGSMDRCILFLRPHTLTGASALANCGNAPAVFYDLAREAIVVAHEYQHYVTDMISGMTFGTAQAIHVGDILHEGYSDYLGASYVTELNSADSTLVGEYALQSCSPLQREISSIIAFDSTADYSSPHRPGIPWASTFWALRSELGSAAADLLALKSQFFLATAPGFFDSIEAVVKADQALNNGANEALIRRLFYEDAKWTGALSGTMKDSARGIYEVGLSGCGAVGKRNQRFMPLELLTFFIWLGLSLFVGRRSWR